MRIVPTLGLIGHIGAGKSTAAGLLTARGGAVIDADKLGHEALDVPAVTNALTSRWGGGILKPGGGVNRRAVAGIVFADAAEKRFLETTVFPVIGALAEDAIRRARADPAVRFVVLDAAVMLEAGWDGIADRLLFLAAPRDVRVLRLQRRAGWSDSDLTAREANQWPAAEKQARADAVVVNDGTVEDLAARLKRTLAGWGL